MTDTRPAKPTVASTLACKYALLPEGWASDVCISIDKQGDIVEVEANCRPLPSNALAGYLLPGIPNLHSHAHQRAIVGLTEKPGTNADSFWTWRNLMYRCLEHLTPDHMLSIASMAYLEMLKSGYTSVAEFQYVHHDHHGSAYDNVAEMSLQTIRAANDTGIAITILPVLYCYSGFGDQPPLPEQRRFICNIDQFADIFQNLSTAICNDRNASIGIAPHSLRAVNFIDLRNTLVNCATTAARPIHIHIAEQLAEVNACMHQFGLAPISWLRENFDLDTNWCLVHATHASLVEIESIAKCGAVVGLCPTTEANLGDGIPDLASLIEHNGRIGIGSDSQCTIDPVEEMRWLEYGQRLKRLTRNVFATEPSKSTGREVFDRVTMGGAQACGRQSGRIAQGYRADFLVVDTNHPRLFGRIADDFLDSWIFSTSANLVRHVFVGGKQIIRDYRHPGETKINARFQESMLDLMDHL